MILKINKCTNHDFVSDGSVLLVNVTAIEHNAGERRFCVLRNGGSYWVELATEQEITRCINELIETGKSEVTGIVGK